MIIDFHVHCFPDELAARTVPALAALSRQKPWVNGTISNIKESMREAGVDRSVVLSIATKPTQTKKINEWAEHIQDDEIISFGSIHPDYEDWKNELVKLKETGIRGIKLHPDYQKFFVDDEKMYPLYEKALEHGFIILFHAGVDIGLPAPFHCTPQRLKKMLGTFKGGKIVAAHMGGFRSWDDVEKLLVGEDIYFDTSCSFKELDIEQFKRIIKNHGYKKILFATDSPWGGQADELNKIKSLGLPQEMQEAILGNNAAELLQI